MDCRSKYFVTDLVDEVGSLPSLAAQVVALTSDPDCDMGALTRVILSDNVLAMRFLALANSAAFAQGQEISNLRGALVRLGIRRVRNVALLMGMHDMGPAAGPVHGLDLVAYRQHCLGVASCAEGLAWQLGMANHEDAWLVGILHGLGVTALAQRTGAGFAAAVDFARQQRTTLVEAEMRVLEFHHGELGARILRAWQLPRTFADAVEFHPEPFDPADLAPGAPVLIGVLRDAIAIARAVGCGTSGDHDPCPELESLAGRLGLAAPALEALAAKVDRDVSEMGRIVGLDLPDNVFARALTASQQAVARLGLEGFDDCLAREELEAELAAARRIQRHLLPRAMPETPGCRLAAVNVPSKSVSGDTYDFLTLADGRTALVIADVCGKGTPAALLASTLQASIRALALVFTDPGALLAAANRALFASTDPERFATVFVAALAPDGTGFDYASAGHNPPLLRRDDGRQEWLRPAGTPLGMMPEMTYPVTRVPLSAGDLLVAYTDGVTEAFDGAGREFGEQGLLEAVVTMAHTPPAVVLDAVVGAVRQHVAGEADAAGPDADLDAGDDLTLIVLKTV